MTAKAYLAVLVTLATAAGWAADHGGALAGLGVMALVFVANIFGIMEGEERERGGR